MNEFQYGGILTKDWMRDRSVYLQPYIEHLIQNYSAAFVQLSYVKRTRMTTRTRSNTCKWRPRSSPRLEPPRQLLGYYYLDVGDTTRAVQHYLNLLREKPGDDALSYRLAGVYERLGRYADALELIDPLYAKEPDAKDLSVMVFMLAARAGMPERARAYMQDWSPFSQSFWRDRLQK